MNKSGLIEFKYDDIYIDNPLLSKNELSKYDINYCFEKVEQKIDDFINMQLDYPYLPKPTITQNYEVRYECFVPRKVDNTAKTVEIKCNAEEKIQRFYSDIVIALRLLSKDEFLYFLECLYYKNSENEFIRVSNTTRYLLDSIKNSCIVKMARCLKCDKRI